MRNVREPLEVPDWQLERFRLQELPALEMARLAEAVTADETLRRRLDGLAADDRAILRDLEPRPLAAVIRSRAAEATPTRRRVSLWQPALAMAAALVVVAVAVVSPSRGPATTTAPALEPTRIKGLHPAILLFRKTSAGAEPLTGTSVAHAGDVVQLAYQAAGRRYGAIVSVDSRGTVTPHLPRSGQRAVELVPGANVPLATAYELDDAPRFEAFYLVVAARPFDLSPVLDAARRAAADPAPRTNGSPARLPLPAGLEQSAFLLKKDMPR